MLSTIITALALTAGASAFVVRRGTCECSFHLTTSGNVGFPVGEDSEGEVLGGSTLSKASFCLDSDYIRDSQGWGCWFTPPTYVFQCDVGATPATGFSIGCDGVLSYNGQTTFYECENGIGDEVNIYSEPDEGANCGSITLTADGCYAGCPTTTTTATPTTTTTATTTTATAAATTCPMTLTSGAFEFPHLIIPIDSASPSTASGTSYFGEVSSTISTIFNFDIPAADSGKTCGLYFLFPEQSQLTTSSFTFSGCGDVAFAKLSGVATQATTYDNAPSVATDYGEFTLAPGHAYEIASFSCPAGQAVSFEMKAEGDTALRYFQDYNPCAIGLYIVPS